MSNYTKLDADVMFLDNDDRVQYEFDLLNHDVEKNIELSYGFSAIRNPREIKKKFKDKKKIGLAIITVLCFILAICLIIFILAYIYFYIQGVEFKTKLLNKVCISFILVFIILVIMYMIFNKMYGEMISLIIMSKQQKKTKRTS